MCSSTRFKSWRAIGGLLELEGPQVLAFKDAVNVTCCAYVGFNRCRPVGEATATQDETIEDISSKAVAHTQRPKKIWVRCHRNGRLWRLSSLSASDTFPSRNAIRRQLFMLCWLSASLTNGLTTYC